MLLVVALLPAGGCLAAVSLVVGEVSDEVTRTVKVRYEVTGNAKNAAIMYSVWRNGDPATSEETARSLPWRKEVEADGLGTNGALVVTLGPDGGRATCTVTVGDGPPRSATASGPLATATCIAP
ncbi:hypothetical protein [Streptomyces sp. NPDC002889]|uniref:hypothetical protein n=1 Tax=Streptomyces sp. NPDC002889 TaxID=3364669 RepID=UPI0036859B10